MDLECFDTYYYVDFSSIQAEKIEKKGLKIRVILSNGVVVYDIPVSDDLGHVKGKGSLINVVNANGGSLSISPYTSANYIANIKNEEYY